MHEFGNHQDGDPGHHCSKISLSVPARSQEGPAHGTDVVGPLPFLHRVSRGASTQQVRGWGRIGESEYMCRGPQPGDTSVKPFPLPFISHVVYFCSPITATLGCSIHVVEHCDNTRRLLICATWINIPSIGTRHSIILIASQTSPVLLIPRRFVHGFLFKILRHGPPDTCPVRRPGHTKHHLAGASPSGHFRNGNAPREQPASRIPPL